MSWGFDLHRMPSVAELSTGLEATLAAQRPSNSNRIASPILAQLLLVHQAQTAALRKGDGLAALEQAVQFVLSAARVQLGAADGLNSAELLHLYYDKNWSIQTIKNNRRRKESVPTLRRRRLAALTELATILHTQEQAARADLRYQLLNQLPPRHYDSVYGRQSTIVELAERVRHSADYWLLNVTGLGGIGKTTLVQETVRYLIDELSVLHIAWIDADVRDGSVSAETIFNQLIAQLSTALHLPTTDPKRQRQRLQTYLKAVPHLIVIDNLEMVDRTGELSIWFSELAQPTKILLVSRQRLKPTRPIWHLSLYEIETTAAWAFVTNRADQLGIASLAEASDTLLMRVQNVLGGHPHALRLFVRLAGYYALDDVLAELESAETDETDTLYTHIYRRVLDYQSDSARQLLYALRIVPSSGATDAYLAAFCGLEKRQRWQAIRQLCDSSLLHQLRGATETRYQIHSLTDTYLGQLDSELSGISAEQITAQMLACCNYWQAQKATMTPATFGTQHPFIYRLVQVGLERTESAVWEAVVNLMLDLYATIENTAYWRDWLLLHEVALGRADSAEPYTRYRLYSRMGDYYLLDDDPQKSIAAHQMALTIAEEMKDLKLRGREHIALGASYRKAGLHQKAVEYGEIGVEIFEELHASEKYLVVAHSTLGQAYERLGQFKDAERAYAKSAEYAHVNAACSTLARLYGNWGDALRFQGNFAAAERKYTRARQLASRSSGQYDWLFTELLTCQHYLDQGQLQQVTQIIAQPAYNYTDRKIQVFTAGEIAITIGRYHLLKGEFDAAQNHLLAALDLWSDIHVPFAEADAYALLTTLHLTQAQLAPHADHQRQAAVYRQKARYLFEPIMIGDWLPLIQRNHPFLFDLEVDT